MAGKDVKSNVEWGQWGLIDPLFGVASWEGKSKGGNSPWQDDEFYALGKSDWADFKRHWVQYGLTNGVCLEIGCGAGRITRHLGGEFKEVWALDVSEAMLAYAKGRIKDANVRFILADGSRLPVSDRSIDAVFSTHVFQHLDTLENAREYFQEIARVMKENGTLMIHLPVFRWPAYRRVFNLLNILPGVIAAVGAAYNRFLIRRGYWRPMMRYQPYEIDWLYSTMRDLEFDDVEIRIFRVQSNDGEHPFLLARKRMKRPGA
jgi:SAM-dependent methyltransferase